MFSILFSHPFIMFPACFMRADSVGVISEKRS